MSHAVWPLEHGVVVLSDILMYTADHARLVVKVSSDTKVVVDQVVRERESSPRQEPSKVQQTVFDSVTQGPRWQLGIPKVCHEKEFRGNTPPFLAEESNFDIMHQNTRAE